MHVYAQKCLDAAIWVCAIKGMFKCWAFVTCWLSSLQVRALSPVLHHSSPHCLSPHLTSVSCHSLMEAPGSTKAHYSLLLPSVPSLRRRGQICFTVIHLSHSAGWHSCCREQKARMSVCLKKEEDGEREKETEWQRGDGREIIKCQESCHVNRCSLFSVLD